MRETGIRESLIVRVEEMISETKSRVRIGKRVGEKYWTARGERQEYFLSSMLFNILLADLKKDMAKGV